MNLDFTEILSRLGPNAAFRIANATRPQAEYLFATLLPEQNSWDYTVKGGSLTVHTTMAGLAALDSPYPPGGLVDMSTFLAEVAKIANEVEISEYTLRQLQQMAMQLQVSGQPTNEALQNEVLNFLDRVVVQAHLDTMEYLRGQALVNGAIDWTFGKLNLVVDYGYPEGALFEARTGTAAWDDEASMFWDDIRLIQSALRWDVRALIMHPDTLFALIGNEANRLEIISQEVGGVTQVRRLVGTNDRLSSDARDTISLIPYGLEAEILDVANPGSTIKVPFMPVGKILGVGRAVQTGYRVGMGSVVDDPILTGAIGYTHLAPTVEGGGRPGRWAELYVPQNMPMKLRGRGVTNGLPVIETPERIVVAHSDLTSVGYTAPVPVP